MFAPALLATGVAACLLAAAGADAHNWVTDPVTRNGNDDNIPANGAPCPMGSMTPVRVNRGDSLFIRWTDNHGSGTHTFNVVRPGNEDTNSNPIFNYVTPPVANAATGVFNNVNFTVPATALGAYTMTYRWASYRNCADLEIVPASMGPRGSDGRYALPAGNGFYNASSNTTTCTQPGDVKSPDPANPGLEMCAPPTTGVATTGSPSSGASSTTGIPCSPGEPGCPCNSGNTCNNGVNCDAATNTCACPPGGFRCPCNAGNTCDGLLVCQNAVCAPAPPTPPSGVSAASDLAALASLAAAGAAVALN